MFTLFSFFQSFSFHYYFLLLTFSFFMRDSRMLRAS